MPRLQNILLLASIIIAVSSINFFNLRQLNKTNGAMCLDGSPYGIYTYEPDPKDVKTVANKLLIFWEDIPFGWCFKTSTSASTQQCHKFITQDNLNQFASSANWSSNINFLDGILSVENGGYFTNWYKVIIKSCDGGSFLGNADPIVFKRQKMYFRGSQNVKEAVNYLNKINYLKNREEVVMVGSFNSGVAALQWSDYFKSQTQGSFRVIADATVFLNSLNYENNQTVIEDRMRQIQQFTLQSTDLPNQACAQANKPDLWKCFFADELIKHINHPVYFLQSLYDGFGIAEVLGFKCAQDTASLSECTQEHRKIIEEYHWNLTSALNIITKQEQHSAYGISCVSHSFLGIRWNNDQFEVPELSGHRAMNSVSSWAQGKGRQLYIDTVEWPNNKPCARKAVTTYNLKIQ